MLKTGIYSLTQLQKNHNYKNFFGGEKKLSITLYDQIITHPDAEVLAERILLYFTDARGAYKRTYSKRFETFDQSAIACIQKHFPSQQVLSLQDVAVSDGRTAYDFFIKIAACYPDILYIASDYDPKVLVLEQGSLKVTLSTQGKVLEIVCPPFVFNILQPENFLYYPLNFMCRWLIKTFRVDPMIALFKDGKLKAKELNLFSPQALTLAQKDSRFIVTQHDLLKPLPQISHIIRAMNVLNASYFSSQEFDQIFAHIHNGLFLGGLFITGSNQDADTVVHGGIYRKTVQGFEKIWQSAEGSPIDQLILEF